MTSVAIHFLEIDLDVRAVHIPVLEPCDDLFCDGLHFSEHIIDVCELKPGEEKMVLVEGQPITIRRVTNERQAACSGEAGE